MGVMYFKRYRMESGLKPEQIASVSLPPGYQLLAWDESLIESHASAKYDSFCSEIDANLFPCLSAYAGCLRLMREISRRDGFCPRATWLLRFYNSDEGRIENCGTIQGVCDAPRMGAIQNLGITPDHRGRGLGTVLLDMALFGFAQSGLNTAHLEVTAHNTGAVRLYQRYGFRKVNVVYKAAEVAFV